MNTDKNLHQRLAAVMQTVTYIQKEKKQGMNYSIVSHDVVTAKVRPALLENGVIYYPVHCSHSHNGNRAECDMTVRFANIDKPDDFIDVQTFGYGVDGQDKGPGKAMSYAVKYALLKALGLETGDDADHDNIDHSRDDPAQAQPAFNAPAAAQRIKDKLNKAKTLQQLAEAFKQEQEVIASVTKADSGLGAQIVNLKDQLKAKLTDDPAMQAPPQGDDNGSHAYQ